MKQTILCIALLCTILMPCKAAEKEERKESYSHKKKESHYAYIVVPPTCFMPQNLIIHTKPTRRRPKTYTTKRLEPASRLALRLLPNMKLLHAGTTITPQPGATYIMEANKFFQKPPLKI